jgi:hypothetical protein
VYVCVCDYPKKDSRSKPNKPKRNHVGLSKFKENVFVWAVGGITRENKMELKREHQNARTTAVDETSAVDRLPDYRQGPRRYKAASCKYIPLVTKEKKIRVS